METLDLKSVQLSSSPFLPHFLSLSIYILLGTPENKENKNEEKMQPLFQPNRFTKNLYKNSLKQKTLSNSTLSLWIPLILFLE